MLFTHVLWLENQISFTPLFGVPSSLGLNAISLVYYNITFTFALGILN